ncbi:hypothetical protein C2845_PM07G20260 [Panicum miliaceum]|uniref:Uncharacterized protein n=1 Tax=Panicum miliaceum TaxID=4540 RepID=A0A3L6SGW3_PANMI|nr:hypothetical protein C2845_PM07G20260 [Panicum miliaceum]
MAALPLRASCWSPLPAVAPAPCICPIRGVMHGRRRAPPVSLKARPRHMFRPHCQKQGADDQYPEGQEGEGGEPADAPPDAVDGGKLLCEMLDKRRAAIRALMGEPPEAPDMFIKEKDQISKYMTGMPSLGFETLNVNATVLARIIFSRSKESLDLASKVMDIAGLRALQATEISQHTTNQMVRAYTSIFCNIVEDAYHGRVKMETIISFLDALRGLGAVCHILVEGTVAKLEDGLIKNKITYYMDKHSQEFDNT